MKHLPCLLFTILSFHFGLSQHRLSGADLLNKAIQYHDPNNRWMDFNAKLNITMSTPNAPKRDSHITINLPNDYFYIKAIQNTVVTEYTLNKGNCSIALNGKTNLSKSELFSNDLSCDRAKLYKNYYTYLYGLPMKLKDEGTIIHDRVEQKEFKGKTYLVLNISYEQTVGTDIWHFYFDPETYAMEAYQFFKTDENGQKKPKSGEYILLTEEVVINGITMPKTRAWYYNKDDSYLGTDTLNQ